MDLRVVRVYDGDGGFVYTVEDVVDRPNAYPFVRHEPYGLVAGDSVDGLKRRLKQMLAACDRPLWELVPHHLRKVTK